jgi:hypothetical protein
MNVTFHHVQIIVIECPLAEACRLRRPLDDLAERLRREMRYGRDCETDSSAATVNPSADFHDTFQFN